jgi:hypothetical protein
VLLLLLPPHTACSEFTTPAAAECIPFGDFKDGGSVSFRVKHGYWYRSIGAIMAPHGEYAYSHANKPGYKVEEAPFWLPYAQASGQATVQSIVEGEAPKEDVQATVTPKPAEAAEAATPKPEEATATPKPAEQTKAAAPSDATVGTAAVNNFFFSDEALQQPPAKHYNKQREHYREAEGYNRHSEYYESEGEYGGYDYAELEAHRGAGDLFMGHISHVQQHAGDGDNYKYDGGYDSGYAATAAAANTNTRASSSSKYDDFLVGHRHGSDSYYGSGGYGSAIKGVEGGIIEFVAGFVDEEGTVLYPTDTGCADWADRGSRDSDGEVPLLLAGASWIQFEKEAEYYGDFHHEAPAYHHGRGGYNTPRY